MSFTHSPFGAILPCTFFSSPLLVSGLALSGLLISADTTAQTATMVDKLKRNEQLSCKPIEPNFCLNMHVSCAGKTNYQAFAFNLQATEKKATSRLPKNLISSAICMPRPTCNGVLTTRTLFSAQPTAKAISRCSITVNTFSGTTRSTKKASCLWACVNNQWLTTAR